ncbi:MAG: class I SAM-dependent methyltransferase [Gaiellaceae bacterium]
MFLLRMLPQGSVGAEIGVWKGDFSARILRVVRPARLHLVDPWAFMGGEPYREARYGGKVALDQTAMDELYEDVLRRFTRPIASGVVEVHRCLSAEAASRFPDGYFDWVYVDGNHLYQFVRRDLELFAPKVRSGGLIAGDDYGVAGWWEDGVTRAVDEFVASGGCELVSRETHQFVLRLSRS